MFLAMWVCLKIVCTPLYPMVLLIIIPTKNGYFIGGINPTFSDIPMFLATSCHVSPTIPFASTSWRPHDGIARLSTDARLVSPAEWRPKSGAKGRGISFFQSCFGKMIKLPDFMGGFLWFGGPSKSKLTQFFLESMQSNGVLTLLSVAGWSQDVWLVVVPFPSLAQSPNSAQGYIEKEPTTSHLTCVLFNHQINDPSIMYQSIVCLHLSLSIYVIYR